MKLHIEPRCLLTMNDGLRLCMLMQAQQSGLKRCTFLGISARKRAIRFVGVLSTICTSVNTSVSTSIMLAPASASQYGEPMPRPPACGCLKTRVGKAYRMQTTTTGMGPGNTTGSKGNNSRRRNSRHQILIFSENSKFKIRKERSQKEQRQKRNKTKMVEMGPDTGPDH